MSAEKGMVSLTEITYKISLSIQPSYSSVLTKAKDNRVDLRANYKYLKKKHLSFLPVLIRRSRMPYNLKMC